MSPSPATASLDSAIAKSSQLSKIIWANSSTTHFAIKQIVRYSRRLNHILLRLRSLPSAHHAHRSTVEACNHKLDDCVSFVDECISFRRDSVMTAGVAALSVDRNAFPTGRALLLSGELLVHVEQLEASLPEAAHTESGPANVGTGNGTQNPANPELRRNYTTVTSSLPSQDYANSIPAFSMTDEYQQGVDVRSHYQLKRNLAVSRSRTQPDHSPETRPAQATPSIQPSSLGSTCSPSPGISALTSSPSLQQSSMTSIHSSRKAPSTSPISPKRLPSLSLGPACLPAHVAVLQLFTVEGYHLPRDTQLLCWRKSSHPDGCVMTWSIQGLDEEFVHYLPHNAFPLTLHKDHNEGTAVQFNTLHKVAIRSDNSERFFSATRVVYNFVQDDAFICFQEDIRRKHLVEVFDFHQILSSRNGHSTYGEAIHGHVKIWQDREPPFHHSISFFGNHVKKDMEFPLLRFHAQFIPKRSEKRVRLTFSLPRKSNEKRSLRGFMSRRTSKSETSTPVSDQGSDLSETSSEISLLMSELKYLELRFDTVEDFDRFIKTFQETRATDEARPTFSLADLTAELENTSLAGELSSEREAAELEALLLTSPTIRARMASESISPISSPRLPTELDSTALDHL